MDLVRLDHPPQDPRPADEALLSHETAEIARPHAIGQRGRLGQVLARLLLEEIHAPATA